jgi:hypothetical protein
VHIRSLFEQSSSRSQDQSISLIAIQSAYQSTVAIAFISSYRSCRKRYTVSCDLSEHQHATVWLLHRSNSFSEFNWQLWWQLTEQSIIDAVASGQDHSVIASVCRLLCSYHSAHMKYHWTVSQNSDLLPFSAARSNNQTISLWSNRHSRTW